MQVVQFGVVRIKRFRNSCMPPSTPKSIRQNSTSVEISAFNEKLHKLIGQCGHFFVHVIIHCVEACKQINPHQLLIHKPTSTHSFKKIHAVHKTKILILCPYNLEYIVDLRARKYDTKSAQNLSKCSINQKSLSSQTIRLEYGTLEFQHIFMFILISRMFLAIYDLSHFLLNILI